MSVKTIRLILRLLTSVEMDVNLKLERETDSNSYLLQLWSQLQPIRNLLFYL